MTFSERYKQDKDKNKSNTNKSAPLSFSERYNLEKKQKPKDVYSPASRQLSVYGSAAKAGAEALMQEDREAVSALYDMPIADIESKISERDEARASVEKVASLQNDIKKLEVYIKTSNTKNPRAAQSKKAAETTLAELKKELSTYDVDATKGTASGVAYTDSRGRVITWDNLLTSAKSKEAMSSPDFDEYVEKGKEIPYTDVGTKKTVTRGGEDFTSYDSIGLAAAVLRERQGEAIEEIPEAVIGKYKGMKDDELSLFAYYLAKDKEDGTSRAKEYIDAIDASLEYRAGEAIAEGLKDNLVGQYAYGVGAGLSQFATGINAALGGETKPNATQYASQLIRENLADTGIDLPDWLGGGSLGQAGYDLVVTGANMLPSIAAGAIVGLANPVAGGYVGNALMGTSAYGNAYQSFLDMGYTKDEARAYGVLVGASEVALGRMLGGITPLASSKGLSATLKNALSRVDNGLARFAVGLGSSMVSEGIEEGAQAILEPIFKSIVAGENIENIDWAEVTYSALLGALSAGVFEAGPTAVNTVRYVNARNQAGRNILKEGTLDSLKVKAGEFVEDRAVEKALNKVNKKASARNVGRLDSVVARAEDAKTTAEAQKITEFVEKVSRGYEPTAEETAEIEAIASKMAPQTAETDEDVALSSEAVADEVEKVNVTENATKIEKPAETKFEASQTDAKMKARALEVEAPTATLESAASKYGAQAGAMMHTYSAGQDVTKFDSAYRAVYDMGREGLKLDYVMMSPLAAYLSPTQRELAYRAGVDSVEMARQKRGEGEVIYEGTTALMSTSELQGASLRAATFLSKALGVDVHVFDSTSEGYEGKNGYYDPTDGSIWLDIRAGNEGTGTMLYTMAHELTHFVQQWSKDKYDAFADFLLENYAEEGVSIDDLVAAQMEKAARHGVELTYDEAFDEVIADSCEAMLADGDVLAKIAELKERDEGLWEKIVEYITALVDKIKAVYKDLKPDSAEGKFVAEQLETFEELKRLWTEAVVEASENYAGKTTQKKTVGNGVKRSYKDDISDYTSNITEKDVQILRSIGRKNVNSFTSDDIRKSKKWAYKFYQELGVKSPFFRAWFGDWREFDKSSTKIIDTLSDDRKSVKNVDTGWEIQASGKIHKETAHHSGSTERNAVKYLPYVDDITKNAVLFTSEISDKDNVNSLMFHTMYAYTEVMGYPALLRLQIEELFYHSKTNSGILKRDYILQSIKEESVSERNRLSRSNHPGTNSSTISISDLFKLVKQYDDTFTYRHVDPILLNKDGTPKIFYHGTNENFNVFDTNEIGPREGSFFFAENKEDARAYGKNVYEVYLTGRNFADYDNQPREFYKLKSKKEQVNWLKEGGYDGWYADMDSDGWGEISVFSNTQIKSATDNVGTFDASNPDIRYSYKDTDTRDLTPEQQALLAGLMAQGRTDAKMIRTRDERLADTKAYYREARARGVESRAKTELRGKIKRKVNELNTLLLKENREKHVPEKLKTAVAMALDAVNMDTFTATERIANLQEELNELYAKKTEAINFGDTKKADSLQKRINDASKSMDYLEKVGDKISDKLEALDAAYREILSTRDGEVVDLEEAKAIREKIDSVKEKVGDTAIRNMSLAQLQSVYDLYKMVLKTVRDANKIFREGKAESIRDNADAIMNDIRALPALPEERKKFVETSKAALWNELILVYAFRRIGSRTLEKFYWDFVKAQNTYARDIDEVTKFAEETRKKYGYDKWDIYKTKEFKTSDGRMMKLSLEHIMSIYAYSKRPQAADHIEFGGFFFNDKETFRRDKNGVFELVRVNDKGYKFNAAELADVIASLTDEQKAYVDEMQKFMSEFGEKGNEASRILWDVDLFKEEHYFPLKSKDDFVKKENQTVQASSLKNDGMTKETVPGASNPIVLESFDSVWANHLERMSKYHAFVVPIDNFNKVFHYGTWRDTDAEAVTTLLRSRYGNAPVAYMDAFIEDLNGKAKSKGATMAIIDTMFGRFKKTAVAGSLSVVVQQPTAILRAMSVIDPKYFAGLKKIEKNPGKTWEEIKKYAPVAIIKEMGGFDTGSGRTAIESINEDTLRGRDRVMKKFDDATMWGAAKADELGWGIIWNAVKREVIHRHQDLSPTSDKFLELCGERFTEVIALTQVYDSTLSRSGFMRSDNAVVKQATAFMGEPTVSTNMLIDAITRAKRGGSKTDAARTISAVYLSVIGAALAKSFIYALRDEDDDESYFEKYGQALGGSLGGGWAGLLSSELSPASWVPYIRDIANLMQGFDVERSDVGLIADLISSVTSLGSEKKSTWRKIEDFVGGFAALGGIPAKNLIRTTREIYSIYENIADGISGGVGRGFAEGFTNTEATKKESLITAIVNGDTARLEVYRDDYDTDKEFTSAILSALKSGYTNKDISKAQVEAYLAKYTDLDNDERKQKVNEWTCKVVTGIDYSNIANEFKSGKITAAKAIDMYTRYGGYTREEARSKVAVLDFVKKNPSCEGITESAVAKYNEHCKNAGVAPATYFRAWSYKKENKKDDVVDYLAAMGINTRQKDALYRAFGYAESELKNTPWH